MVYATNIRRFNTIFVDDNLVMDNDARISNTNESSYGWNDITAHYDARNSGSTRPTFGVVRDGFYGFLFSPTAMNEVFITFHILHDVIANTLLYPHIHFMPMTALGGVVRFGVEYTICKGHDQAEFPATATIYLEHTISAGQQYRHIVLEASDLQAINYGANLEPDTCILMRVFRDATHPNDTYAGDIHSWQADIHYQSSNFNSKNKEPNFFT